MSKWYETLSTKSRGFLFTWMQEADNKAKHCLSKARKLEPPSGHIAIGAAAFDEFIKGEVIEEYLRSLRSGKTPERALESTLLHSRFCIRLHNSRRPKDINWQRPETIADFEINNLHRSLQTQRKRNTKMLYQQKPRIDSTRKCYTAFRSEVDGHFTHILGEIWAESINEAERNAESLWPGIACEIVYRDRKDLIKQ